VLRAELVRHFLPEVKLVEQLIGRDLSHWKH
jgi:hypothetical protein